MKKFFFTIIFSLGVCSPGSASPYQIEFVAGVDEITLDDELNGLLKMSLTPQVKMDVRVSDVTEVRNGSAQLSLADLSVGMILRVEGFFSDEGISAQEIEVTEEPSELELKGEITAIEEEERIITVAGFLVHVSPETEISDPESGDLQFEDLELFQEVKVEAEILDEQIQASEIQVAVPEKAYARLSFEGIVLSTDETEFLVEIEGAGPVLVLLSEETKIKGEISPGLLVRVIGKLTPELSVEAHKVLVKKLIQLAPSHLKAHAGQSRRVEVILRNPLEREVELLISSEDVTIALPDVSTLVIPAGQPTGAFEVEALGVGETLIHVSMPQDLGGLTVSQTVRVREKGKKDGDDGHEVDEEQEELEEEKEEEEKGNRGNKGKKDKGKKDPKGKKDKGKDKDKDEDEDVDEDEDKDEDETEGSVNSSEERED